MHANGKVVLGQDPQRTPGEQFGDLFNLAGTAVAQRQHAPAGSSAFDGVGDGSKVFNCHRLTFWRKGAAGLVRKGARRTRVPDPHAAEETGAATRSSFAAMRRANSSACAGLSRGSHSVS